MAGATRFGVLSQSCWTAGLSLLLQGVLLGAFQLRGMAQGEDQGAGHVFGATAAGSVQAGSLGVGVALAPANSISMVGYVVTIVVLLAAGLALLFRGNLPMAFAAGSKGQRKLHIEETKSVGNRQYLLVAEYEGRRFLLGVCPGRIDYLSGLDSDPAPPAGSFQELLQPTTGSRPETPIS
jgi:flagellar biogenesis protein FliO